MMGSTQGGYTMPKYDLSFDFGYNLKPKKAKSTGGKKKGKRQLSAAQKATAALYMRPRRR
jgi:hypothetical protein